MLLMATQEIHSIILTSLFLKWFDILFVWLICCCREILVYYPLEGWNVNQEIWKLLSLFFYYEIRTLRLVCQLCSKGEFWPCAQEVWIWLQTASQTLCGKLLTLQSYKAVLSPAHLSSQMGDWGWALSSSGTAKIPVSAVSVNKLCRKGAGWSEVGFLLPEQTQLWTAGQM